MPTNISNQTSEYLKYLKDTQGFNLGNEIDNDFSRPIPSDEVLLAEEKLKQQILHIIGNVKGGVITPQEAVELIDKLYTNGNNLYHKKLAKATTD
jgi:hypothetical protein